MNNLSLVDNLGLAWLQRAESAANDLDHATKAPALFRPEFIAQRQADYDAAMKQVRRWSWSA